MSKIVPLNFQQHGKKTLLPLSSYTFASGQTLVPLTALEFPPAAHRYPIVFSKQGERIGVFVLLGLAPGENLFIDSKGRWLSDYIPAILRKYPFVFGKASESSADFVLCIDEESGLLADSGGEALFSDEGEKTPVLEKVLAFVTECQKSAHGADQLCAVLEEKGLLAPLDLQIKTEKDKGVKIEGLLRVDEQKLKELPDEAFLQFRSSGVLPLIYAHLFSLANLQVLVQRKKSAAAASAVKQKLPDSFNF